MLLNYISYLYLLSFFGKGIEKGMPIVLNTENEKVYTLNNEKRVISKNFLEWLNKNITDQISL